MPLTQSEAQDMLATVLGAAFDLARFRVFIANLLPGCEILTEGVQTGAYIPEKFRDDIASYQRVAKSRTADGQRLDVLAVRLRTPAKLARARFMQRNFIARYLNGGWGGEEKDAALVAFTADNAEDWRFSLVFKKYVFDEQGVRVALSEPRRCSFLVGPHEGTHTARQQLAALLTSPDPLPLEALESAFLVEPVERAFFAEYKELYDKLVAALADLRHSDPALEAEFSAKSVSSPDFAKRLLGQMVFLYFLQRKGWLGVAREGRWGDGSPAWIRECFDTYASATGNRFFNDWLEPLFYDALARDRSTDSHWHDALNCRIPFLNGGLFEPLGQEAGYDWRFVDVLLPDSLFADILTVFDRYNFTVDEDEPLDTIVAVDPEMLGKVFENLLEVEERGTLGTFYTPRNIVQYMCREALARHLDRALNIRWNPQTSTSSAHAVQPRRQEKVSLAEIEAFLRADENVEQLHSKTSRKQAAQERSPENSRLLPPGIAACAQEVDAALASMTVCDPAIGSGAFCVGMMHEIVRARQALAEQTPDLPRHSVYDLKRHAIQHSLYGVDVDASAVDIAKLRLWLSLVVDEDDFDSIKPLPNLDYRIMPGNSLDSLRYDHANSLLYVSAFARLAAAHEEFFNATDRQVKAEIRKRIDACKAEMGCHNAFDWSVDFQAIFDPKLAAQDKGFDVVIANPPYVRQERISALKPRLKIAFGAFFCGTADLYTYFYALALERLLKPLGHCCFIAPNKFFRAAYGKNLRTLLTSQAARVRSIVDFGDLDIFAEATTYPSIVLAQRAVTRPDERILTAIIKDRAMVQSLWRSVQEQGQEVPASQLSPQGWSLEPPARHAVLEKIRRAGRPLGDIVNGKMYRGVLTGFNQAFVIDGATRERLVADDPNCEEIIKPWLRGRDISKWRSRASGLYVIFTRRGIDIELYPSIKRHLSVYRAQLEPKPVDWDKKNPGKAWPGRKAGSYKWYEIQDNIAYYNEFSRPKIIWPDMAQQMRACFDISGSFCANTAYICPLEDFSLLAILQSKIFHFFAEQLFAVFQGATFRFIAQSMETVPIPKATPTQREALNITVTSILAAKDADSDADVTALEDRLDCMVYELYGLTDDDIAVIQGAAPVS